MSGKFWQSEDGRVRLHNADALDVLRELEAGSIDALFADTPDSSGGMYRGDRAQDTRSKYIKSDAKHTLASFSGDNRDQRSYRYWSDLWMRLARRALRPGAPACVFTDWRQLPITVDAFQAAGFVWRGVAVWDKTECARPQLGRYRAQAEYIVWGSNGAMPLEGQVLPGVFRVPQDTRDRLHQTAKPVALMEQVIRICRPDGIILDPFAGSGSTAVAALAQGRQFIGCEIDPHYFRVAVERVQRATRSAA